MKAESDGHQFAMEDRGKSTTSAIARFWSVWGLSAIMVLVLLSASVESADIKIKVVDPSTGKTISRYTKNYSPMEKEQIQKEVEQKRAAEDKISGLIMELEQEERKLQEQLDRVRSSEVQITEDNGIALPVDEILHNFKKRDDEGRAVEQQIEELREDFEYKKEQAHIQ